MPSHYIRTYNTLLSGTGKICRDEGIGIDRNDYANGYALYTFDLTSDLEDEKNFNLMRQRSVRLVLKLGQALTTTVTTSFRGARVSTFQTYTLSIRRAKNNDMAVRHAPARY